MQPLIAILEAARRQRWLERLTLVYVLLPFFVFALGWLRPLVSLPASALVLVALYRAQRAGGAPAAGPPATSRDALTYLFLLAVVVVVVALSGTGAYTIQMGGHHRANAFLRDLVSFPWPVGYEETGRQSQPGVLAFYIGNALLPALAGKLLGWAATFHASYLLGVLGVFLAVCWFLRVTALTSPLVGLLFLLFGGLDLVGQSLILPEAQRRFGLDLWIFSYAVANPDLMQRTFWIYPSNLTVLFSSPHHVLCTWLALLLVLDDALRRGTCRRAGLVWAPVLLWSAFGFVGMAPFLLVAAAVSRGRGLLSYENAVGGGVVLLLVGLYLASNNQEYVRGFLWQFQDLTQTGPLLALVCALEFGLYALLAAPRRGRAPAGMPAVWWVSATLVLLLLPWYRIGDFCDLPAKATPPALLVLQVWLVRWIASARAPAERLRAAALVALLLVGTASALGSLAHPLRRQLHLAPPPIQMVKHANEIERFSRGGQLFSDGRGFFWRVLARPVRYQAVGATPPRPRPEARP